MNGGSPTRDPIGERPLYRYDGPNGPVFSESVRDLLAQGVPRKLSIAGLRAYLEYGCACEPLTLIERISAVPPSFDVGAVVPREWKGPEDAQDAVTAALEASIARQMVPDAQGRVPAAFLSGGIDSGAIVALMRRTAPDAEIRTYCVTHEDPRTDERLWARKVADANGTQHTELMLTGEMIGRYLEDAISCYDQPSLDGLNFWFVSKLVSEAGEKTVLSGEGGDELFVGYGRFANQRLCERWARRLRMFPAAFGTLFMKWGPNDRVRKFGQLFGCRTDPYFESRRIFDRVTINALLRPDLREAVKTVEPYSATWYRTFGRHLPSEWINATSWKELRTVLLSMYLHDGYQVSRPFGLDVRTPLLDEALVNLMFTIPGEWKCSGEFLKPFLVRAAGAGLPRECVVRPKQGFSLPFDRYFNGTIRDRIDAFLFGGESRLFDAAALASFGRRYRAGKVYWSRVWTLFMLDDWCKRNGVEP